VWQAVESDPNLLQAHFNRGVIVRPAGQSESAVADFRKPLQREPDFEKRHP
jgi:Tfp pilus assembly protein PilF